MTILTIAATDTAFYFYVLNALYSISDAPSASPSPWENQTINGDNPREALAFILMADE